MAQRVPVLEPSIDDLVQTYDRTGPFPISETDYVRLALEDEQTQWELHNGLLVEKPGISFTHFDVASIVVHQLAHQLDFWTYRVLSNDGRLRWGERNYLIPDVSVVAAETLRRLRKAQPFGLGVFNQSLLFVAEAWSPSTGRYDVNFKIPIYKERGDLEIWRIHPLERTVMRWTRNDDGTYTETRLTGGIVRLFALPFVEVDIDALFEGDD